MITMKKEESMPTRFDDHKKNRVRGSIVAFINGKMNMDWIMGTIKGKWGVRGKELEEIFAIIPYAYINYDSILFEQLKQKCLEEGLLKNE